MKKRFTEEQIIGFLLDADASMAIKEPLMKRPGQFDPVGSRVPPKELYMKKSKFTENRSAGS